MISSKFTPIIVPAIALALQDRVIGCVLGVSVSVSENSILLLREGFGAGFNPDRYHMFICKHSWSS